MITDDQRAKYAQKLFDAAYDEVMTTGATVEDATQALAGIMTRLAGYRVPTRVSEDETPILNGRAAAYRALGAHDPKGNGA